MSRFRGALFDLDGVLLNTAVYHFQAWKRLANELGFDLSSDQNQRLKGVSREESLEILLRLGGIQFSDEEKMRLAARKNEWYRESIQSLDPSEVLPGSREILEKLREAGVVCALASASKNAMTILDSTSLQAYFDVFCDGNTTSKAKPDPEIFVIAAAGMGLEWSDCVVFEDALAGIRAARSIGMCTVGIGREEHLMEADHVQPDLQAVLESGLFEVLFSDRDDRA